jgi:signal transduction histidine kinase
MKLSIRLKFLMVMSGLLIVCLAFYLLMSVTVFKSDKTQLVYDLNRSQVSNLASEIETRLLGVDQTLGLFAQLSQTQQRQLIDGLFSEDSDVVFLQVYKNGKSQPNEQYFAKEYLQTYGLQESDLAKKLDKHQQIPFDLIMASGQGIWNASVQDLPPLIGYGKLVLVLDEEKKPIDQWVLVSYLKIDSFVKSVSLLQLSEIRISNSQGEVLVQKDVAALADRPQVKTDPLFQQAQNSSAGLSVTHVEHPEGGWLSAYAKAFDEQLVVMAKSPEREVFKVVQALTFRTFLFGSIVLTLVILAAFLLSRSLTRNIALLAKRMAEAAKGDLSTHLQLRGQDETVSLGQSFNKMINDLRKSRDELEIMNRELDQKVKDRTKELEIQNQKVAEAQEAMLHTARLASMGEVAGRTAHEVLNPLTSLLTRAGLAQKRAEVNYQQPLELLDEIGEAWQADYKEGGFANLVKNWQQSSSVLTDENLFVEDVKNITEIRKNLKAQADEIAKDMKFIREEGDRIGKIIHGMRRLGNRTSDVKPQSLHELLADCCYIMADLYDQQRFKIIKNFDADSDRVKVDRDEFIQAVTNLLRNSLQALLERRDRGENFSGKVTIDTRVTNRDFVISITDNGSGINPENQAKLFKVNFTTKSSDEGTGLGLGISRRFIRAYDGDIRFVKTPDEQKTVFEIRLPLVNQQPSGKAVA